MKTEPSTPPARTFLEQTAAAVASTLQLDPQHVGVAIAEGLRSAYITSCAIAAALVVGAAAAGQFVSPRAFFAFAAANWWVTTATIVTTAIRSRSAYREAVKAGS